MKLPPVDERERITRGEEGGPPFSLSPKCVQRALSAGSTIGEGSPIPTRETPAIPLVSFGGAPLRLGRGGVLSQFAGMSSLSSVEFLPCARAGELPSSPPLPEGTFPVLDISVSSSSLGAFSKDAIRASRPRPCWSHSPLFCLVSASANFSGLRPSPCPLCQPCPLSCPLPPERSRHGLSLRLSMRAPNCSAPSFETSFEAAAAPRSTEIHPAAADAP
mmetsp:Transcript_33192/g.82611  ORF Transcript_33192/g.82611 Transcript_33192/m.82611 type:complete len:218 (+) Transcript_33192:1524-2177(+)